MAVLPSRSGRGIIDTAGISRKDLGFEAKETAA
jgi:hypothetical protein